MDVPGQRGDQRDADAVRKGKSTPDVEQVFAALDSLERFFSKRGGLRSGRAVDYVLALRRIVAATDFVGGGDAGSLGTERIEGWEPIGPGILPGGAADELGHEGVTRSGARLW